MKFKKGDKVVTLKKTNQEMNQNEHVAHLVNCLCTICEDESVELHSIHWMVNFDGIEEWYWPEENLYLLPKKGDKVEVIPNSDFPLSLEPVAEFIETTDLKWCTIEAESKKYLQRAKISYPLFLIRPIKKEEKSTVRINTMDGRPTDDSLWNNRRDWLL